MMTVLKRNGSHGPSQSWENGGRQHSVSDKLLGNVLFYEKPIYIKNTDRRSTQVGLNESTMTVL